MNLRILQITEAAAGWRTVSPYLGAMGPLENLANEQLYELQPIACFALVEELDAGDPPPPRHVEPIVASDWPAYLYFAEGGETNPVMDILGPGQEPEEIHRDEAIRMILAYRNRGAAEESRG